MGKNRLFHLIDYFDQNFKLIDRSINNQFLPQQTGPLGSARKELARETSDPCSNPCWDATYTQFAKHLIVVFDYPMVWT